MHTEFEINASIHDIMPASLDATEQFTARLEHAGLAPALLLVVPGCDWSGPQLARLRTLVARGHALAGHGWQHRAAGIRGLYHRLHSAVLSRDAAEHLALDTAAVIALIRDCRAWFDAQALPAPETYVPPAWAMGKVQRRQLHGLGFRYFEYLTGVYDTRAARLARLPLVGFEADTPVRRHLLRASNALNLHLARRCGRLRLAIHPHDDQLLLAGDLARWLAPGQHRARLPGSHRTVEPVNADNAKHSNVP